MKNLLNKSMQTGGTVLSGFVLYVLAPTILTAPFRLLGKDRFNSLFGVETDEGVRAAR